ncbi:hypothetical protein PGT21_005346 [Puccinia graminis f. sp. tritici]|uniref:Uncharacterized protein n=1 Tax=Puccinia graminis f. sp. tritici TaxID=56615 RepID=A0A5B0MN98_PUCGR|nr:hypothetical protein PGT21_005346 [Puccinia graminis f. sp. tritici]
MASANLADIPSSQALNAPRESPVTTGPTVAPPRVFVLSNVAWNGVLLRLKNLRKRSQNFAKRDLGLGGASSFANLALSGCGSASHGFIITTGVTLLYDLSFTGLTLN